MSLCTKSSSLVSQLSIAVKPHWLNSLMTFSYVWMIECSVKHFDLIKCFTSTKHLNIRTVSGPLECFAGFFFFFGVFTVLSSVQLPINFSPFPVEGTHCRSIILPLPCASMWMILFGLNSSVKVPAVVGLDRFSKFLCYSYVTHLSIKCVTC